MKVKKRDKKGDSRSKKKERQRMCNLKTKKKLNIRNSAMKHIEI